MLGRVTAVALPTNEWVTVPHGAVLRCPGFVRVGKRAADGRFRCAEPVLRAALRGLLRWRLLTTEEDTLDSVHRCHSCGTRIALRWDAAR